MTEKDKAEICYRSMYDGMIRKDAALLSDLLDDSFVLIHMTGMRQSKEAFIQALEDGTLNYYSVSHQKIKAEIQNETAKLIGQSIVSAAVFGGGRHIWRLQLNMRLIKKGDRWAALEAQASTY